ncbi:MAG: Gfo/Idh/MocA family oxidoreductase [Oscillospiraceae bacterium]|nr:Gfo/Idh/MocA family oxidoreductase [Oscillospiraceae bacterium]
MSELKAVLIGSSGHAQAFCLAREYPGLNFAAYAAGNPGEQNPGLPKEYADWRQMLAAENPDIVVVDNFYAHHAAPILAALERGCHVFAEKPLDGTPAELAEIEEKWKTSGCRLAAMLNYRVNGAFLRAKQLIDEGRIGEIRLLNAQKSYKYGTRPDFMSRRESYGGTIPWVGIHAVDWILWMSGAAPLSVTAVQSACGAPNGTCPEITALAQFELDREILASLTVDYLRPEAAPNHGDDRIRIMGTAGSVEVREGKVILTDRDGLRTLPPLPDGDIFASFLAAVRGEGKCAVSAEESIAASRAVLLAQLAADTGKKLTFEEEYP